MPLFASNPDHLVAEQLKSWCSSIGVNSNVTLLNRTKMKKVGFDDILFANVCIKLDPSSLQNGKSNDNSPERVAMKLQQRAKLDGFTITPFSKSSDPTIFATLSARVATTASKASGSASLADEYCQVYRNKKREKTSIEKKQYILSRNFIFFIHLY